MPDIGMIRVAAIAPKLKIGNPEYNGNEILKCIGLANEKGAGLIVFPRLSLTGATCGSLFKQKTLYEGQIKTLNNIALATKKIGALIVLGAYLPIENKLMDITIYMQNGLIIGVTPYNNSEANNNHIPLLGCDIPMGNLVFAERESGLTIGSTAGQTVGLLSPLSSPHIICQPAASEALVGSAKSNRYTVLQRSKDHTAAYVYASSGIYESTSSALYSGHCAIAEAGALLNEDAEISFENKIICADIDFEAIMYRRNQYAGIACQKNTEHDEIQFRQIGLRALPLIGDKISSNRHYPKTPFIPENKTRALENCKEAFLIQAFALARRLEHTASKKAVIGISGGLDSTLALLVSVQAMKLLGRPAGDVLTITMPGFGTTGRTYENAILMMKTLGTEIREISIKEATLLHFKDIGHNPENKNVVYENVQARERTQILMDIANMEHGILVGTGDLSEAALGWSTYNGDHMSMYNVNAGIPKTFIRVMIDWLASSLNGIDDIFSDFSNDNSILASTLQDVLDTPVSPELLPPNESGEIDQKTEDKVGPYELHDFFIYHTVKNGAGPEKLLAIAKLAFDGQYDENFIKKWMQVFYKRFFQNQFKRSCTPDSPRIGSVSLSREDWRMPSDGDPALWSDILDRL